MVLFDQFTPHVPQASYPNPVVGEVVSLLVGQRLTAAEKQQLREYIDAMPTWESTNG